MQSNSSNKKVELNVQEGVQWVSMRTLPPALAASLPRAADLIADRGLEQLRVEDLSQATGVPKATLYYYFTGKDDVLGYLLRDLLTSVSDAVAEAAARRGTACQRLDAVIHAQFRVLAAQPSMWRALVAHLGKAAQLPDVADLVAAGFHAPIERLLAEGRDDGSLRNVMDPPAAARAIFGAVSVVVLHSVAIGTSIEPAKLANDITELVLHGVRRRTVKRPR